MEDSQSHPCKGKKSKRKELNITVTKLNEPSEQALM